jgi:primosomal protein N'
VIIQTFRPDAPEVISASRHETEKYLDDELKLRLYASYPPATEIVRLILRGPDAEKRAKLLYRSVQKIAFDEKNDAKIHAAETLFGAGKIWHVLMRGSHPRSILPFLDLDQVIIDIDPMETL